MGLHTLRNRLAMCTSAVKVTVAAANAGLTPEELKDLIDGVLRVANRYAEVRLPLRRFHVPHRSSALTSWP